MFIRKTTRRYKDRTYTNYLLVRSVHTAKGPRQKVICSLGDLSPRPAAEWLRLAHKVEDALAGQPGLWSEAQAEVAQIVAHVRQRQARIANRKAKPTTAADDLVAVHADRVSTERSRAAGPVHVGYQFWKRLGLEEIFQGLNFSQRAIPLTCAMTLNRLIHPSSEHAMPDWIRRTALGDILGVDFEGLADDALYRNLDRLYPDRATIETALVERERSLFNLQRTVFFCDLTSTYFEGQAELIDKAKRGYSRDKRPDCKQVVVGLVIGGEGFPLTHEVFAGNVQDRQTVAQMLDLLAARVGLAAGTTVVVDRGMAYAENLEEIKQRQLHYVIAARQPERDGETFILCTSSGRVAKDRMIREKQEQRFLADVGQLQRRIDRGRLVREVAVGEAIGRLKERYPRVARYHHLGYDAQGRQLVHEPNLERKARAELLDGGYLLRTDREDLDAEQAWLMYMTLTRAEAAFRAMKSPLAERPIFHHLEHRVETHIFLCVLAYHLLVAIETTLLGKGVHTSWATVRETLQTHHVNTIVLPTDHGAVLRIRKASTPEPEHRDLYRLLDVPTEVIEPKKTWTPPERASHSD